MRSLAAAMGVALAFAALGCGGDDDEPDAGLSRVELARQGNAICVDFRDRLAAIPPPQEANDPETNAQFVRVEEDFIRRMRELEPEESIGDDYEAYVDKHEQALDIVRQVRETPIADRARRDELQDQVIPLQRELPGRARALGLTRCGGG